VKLPHATFKLLLAFAISLGISSFAHAASLDGTVAEIHDGDTITIICLKRPLKVKLMAIDAPEKGQAYADVAKQHLTDLILNKFVSVEYSGLGPNGLIIGKVYIKEMDVGAQMIRDGVAWYDKTYESRLTETERQVYAASEIAARNEQRGIWQDTAPVPPWAYRDGQVALRTSNDNTKGSLASSNIKRARRQSLSNDDLMNSFGGSVGSTPAEDSSPSTVGSGEWKKLAPSGEHFSALVPEEAQEYSATIPAGDNKTAEMNYSVANHNGVLYLVLWSHGPNDHYTDAIAADELIKGLTTGLNRGLRQRGLDVNVETTEGRDLEFKGYLVRQYKLAGGVVPGVIRAFTRRKGQQREVYMLGALNGAEGNAAVDRFLNSFAISKN
jgi:endonuclease YncB( thermonuclease family)